MSQEESKIFVSYKTFQYEISEKQWESLPRLFKVKSTLSEMKITREYWDFRNGRFVEVEAIDPETFEAMKLIPSRFWKGTVGRVFIKYKRLSRRKRELKQNLNFD